MIFALLRPVRRSEAECKICLEGQSNTHPIFKRTQTYAKEKVHPQRSIDIHGEEMWVAHWQASSSKDDHL